MKIEATLGNPVEPGLYCARQWYGYRILEWDGTKWWHPGRSAPWPVAAVGNKQSIEAHIGPLPVISMDYTKPPLGIERKPEPEYDL